MEAIGCCKWYPKCTMGGGNLVCGTGETIKMEENEPVMYLFVNKGLGMSPGKMAAQVAHAAVKASDGSDTELRKLWNEGGHYTKLVMEARDSEHLKTIQKYLEDRGFDSFLIIDEGRTEIDPHQPTALGVEVVDKSRDHVRKTFQTFGLYKPEISISIKFN